MMKGKVREFFVWLKIKIPLGRARECGGIWSFFRREEVKGSERKYVE